MGASVRVVEMDPPHAAGQQQHGPVSSGNGEDAKEHASVEIRFQHGPEHIAHGIEAMPGDEAAPSDLVPVDGGEIQVQAAAADEIAQISRCSGDGHHGPGIVDERRDEHERPVEAAEQRAEQQYQNRMQPEQGIEGDGQAEGEAPGDILGAQVGMKDVQLEFRGEASPGRFHGSRRRWRCGQWAINHEWPGRSESWSMNSKWSKLRSSNGTQEPPS